MVHFFEGTNKEEVRYKKTACLGISTASKLKEYQIEPDFVGTEDIIDVANYFINKIDQDFVLFPRAEVSKRSIQKRLNSNQVEDLIVYKTIEKDILLERIYDVILFTSPSNVRAFFNSGNTIGESQRAIAIGLSTKSELESFNVEAGLAISYLEKDWLEAVLSTNLT